MALIDKLFNRRKTLSELSPQELRKEEILIGKQRDKLFKHVEQIALAEQKIFQQGAAQNLPNCGRAGTGF